MNSILKSAAKILEELKQRSGMNDAKQDGMQHTKGRLGEVLKKKWKNKVMHGQYIRNMDRQLISEEDTVPHSAWKRSSKTCMKLTSAECTA